MRHVLRDSFVFAATLAATLVPALVHAEPIRLGTGSKGGDFHVLGNALAADFEARGGSVQLAVESTKGSCENIKRLLEGSLDIALVQYDVAAEAYRASQMEPPKAGELEQFGGWMCKISPQLARQAELRLVAAVSDSAVHLLVRRPVRIDTITTVPGARAPDDLVPYFGDIARAGRGAALVLGSSRDLAAELLLASFGAAWREPLRALLEELDAFDAAAAAR